MKFCSNCGAQLNDGAVFCNKCGARFYSSDTSPGENTPRTSDTYPKNDVTSEKNTNTSKKTSTKKGILIVVAVLCILVVGAGCYFLGKGNLDLSSLKMMKMAEETVTYDEESLVEEYIDDLETLDESEETIEEVTIDEPDDDLQNQQQTESSQTLKETDNEIPPEEETYPEEIANSEPIVMTEQEAYSARQSGTLIPDPYQGYDHYAPLNRWCYTNYPNYKDFNADGKIKVAFICKWSSNWFIPKATAVGKTVEGQGYEFLYIDANSNRGEWMKGVKLIINNDFDVAVLSALNENDLTEAITLLQDAGIAYITTDDPGIDQYGFYAPHQGLDDYRLHYQLGEYVANKATTRGFFSDVGANYDDVMLVMLDSPTVDAIHERNRGFHDAIRAAYPGIPETQIRWVDCGGSTGEECYLGLNQIISEYGNTTRKWIISSGGASAIKPTVQLLHEYGIDLSNCLIADTFTNSEPINVMKKDGDACYACFGAFLASAPSGVTIANEIIDLIENKTPIPAFTNYDFIPCDADTVYMVDANYCQ